MKTTSEFAPGVSHPVQAALRSQGITSPFPIQEQVLPAALRGRDVLAQSPTGSGKTLAFGIALVERLGKPRKHVQAVVLVPTRELAVQVTSEVDAIASAHRMSTVAVYGGAALRPQARAARTADIIIATPGRLEDLLQQRLVDVGKVEIVVLDEADRMCDMGFAPQVEKLLDRMPRKRQTMLFSATLEGDTARLARRYTHDPVLVSVAAADEDLPDIEHEFFEVEHTDKLDALLEAIDTDRDLAVVFVRTKRGADRLSKRLRQRGISSGALHGGMTQSARLRELRAFGAGRIDTLVATDVFARGMDLDRVTLVVNYDPPEDADAYTHRAGRTGRAGRSGRAVTFVLGDQRAEVTSMVRALGLLDQVPPSRRHNTNSTTSTPTHQHTRTEQNMATGTVKWFSDEKGFGFITPEGGAKDVFVHHSNIAGTGFSTLAEGAKVEFETQEGRKGLEAVDVKVV